MEQSSQDLLKRSALDLTREELPPHYTDIEPLAQGGMGALFTVLDTRVGRKAVVKVLLPQLLVKSRDTAKQRFLREAETIRRLSHPYIVEVRDVGGSQLPYYVMDFVEGATLREHMDQNEIDVQEALRITLEICDALIHAHFKGVIHRDLKPENVFVLPHGGIKVVDFGIAHVTELTQITSTGAIVGTPLYMAPEQLRGEEIDARADIYALAVMCYEMLTGSPPFPATRFVSKLTVDAPPPAEANPLVSPPLDGTLLKALSRYPEQRQASMDELKWELSACLKDYRDEEDLPLAGSTWEALLLSDLERLSIDAPAADEKIVLAEGDVREVTLMAVRLTGLSEEGDEERAKTQFVRNRIIRVFATEIERYGGAVDSYGDKLMLAYFGSRSSTGAEFEHAVRAGLKILEKLETVKLLLRQKGLDLDLALGIDRSTVTVGPNASVNVTQFSLLKHVDSLTDGTLRLTKEARPLARGHFALGTDETYFTEVLGLEDAPKKRSSRTAAAGRLDFVGPRAGINTILRTYDLASERLLRKSAAEASGQAPEKSGNKRKIAGRRRPVPTLVTVRGDTGAGKTRLIEETLDEITARRPGAIILADGCTSYDRSAYAIVARLLRQALEIEEAISPADFLAALNKRCSIAQGEDTLETNQDAKTLAFVLGIGEEDHREDKERDAERLGPTALRLSLARSVTELLRTMAKTGDPTHPRPVAIVIEDLQWIDDPSRTLLETLLTSLGHDLFLILSFRVPHRIPERWKRYTHHVPITIAPLDDQGSRAFLRAVLKGALPPPAILEEVLARSGGNPFFLRETMEYLIDTGALDAGETAVLSGVPHTVKAVVLSRIDLLPRREREVLQTCAILGGTFDGAVLEEMAPRIWTDELILDEALTRLEALHFLEGGDDDGEAIYAFRQSLVRDAVYSTILNSNRQILHELAAQCMEKLYRHRIDEYSARLAYHFNRSGETGKALDYTKLALDEALRRYDHVGCLQRAEEALALLAHTDDDPATRFEILQHREKAFELTGCVTDQGRDLEELEGIARALGDETRISEILNRRSWFLWWNVGDYPQAEALARDALELGERLQDTACQALALRNLGSIEGMRSRPDEALLLHDRARELYGRCGNRSGEAASICSRAINLDLLGKVDAAVCAAKEALTIDRTIGDLRGVGREQRVLGDINRGVGKLQEALASYAKSLENDRQIGYRMGQALNLANTGQVLFDLGETKEALTRYGEALEIAREISSPRTESGVLLGLARVRNALGDEKGGLISAEAGLSLAEAIGAPALEAEGYVRLAALLINQGQMDEALLRCKQAVTLLAKTAATPPCSAEVFFVTYGAYLANGETEQAHNALRLAKKMVDGKASRLDEEAHRRTFLESLPLNRAIMDTWRLVESRS